MSADGTCPLLLLIDANIYNDMTYDICINDIDICIIIILTFRECVVEVLMLSLRLLRRVPCDGKFFDLFVNVGRNFLPLLEAFSFLI